MLFKSHFFFPKKLQIIVIMFFQKNKEGGEGSIFTIEG